MSRDTSKGRNIDFILDRFSKAHPFADTRAYNIYHEEAKQLLTEYIKEIIPEKKQPRTGDQRRHGFGKEHNSVGGQLYLTSEEKAYNQAIDDFNKRLEL